MDGFVIFLMMSNVIFLIILKQMKVNVLVIYDSVYSAQNLLGEKMTEEEYERKSKFWNKLNTYVCVFGMLFIICQVLYMAIFL